MFSTSAISKLPVLRLPDDDGDFREAGFARRAIVFAGNDLIPRADAPDDQRLYDPLLDHGFRELGESHRIDVLPRLLRVGVDAIGRELEEFLPLSPRGRIGEERREPLTEHFALHARESPS
jgi:hypothetical protein